MGGGSIDRVVFPGEEFRLSLAEDVEPTGQLRSIEREGTCGLRLPRGVRRLAEQIGDRRVERRRDLLEICELPTPRSRHLQADRRAIDPRNSVKVSCGAHPDLRHLQFDPACDVGACDRGFWSHRRITIPQQSEPFTKQLDALAQQTVALYAQSGYGVELCRQKQPPSRAILNPM